MSGAPVQGGYGRGQATGGEVAQILLDGEAVPFSDEGRFFIAYQRDAPPVVQLQVRYADGTSIDRPVEIADVAFPESRLPPITQRIEASADFQRKRAEEVSRITASREGRSGLEGWRDDFTAPAEGRISGVFGSQRFYGDEARSPHGGLDIAAPEGAAVSAPASGRVVLAGGSYSFEGNLVILDHGLGLFSAFLHLSRIDVKEGDVLAQGDLIGAVGATGRATGAHLHWGLWWNGVRFDPATLLSDAT
ncbi:M23 family metallopeptidase [Pacificimonas sp. ICDLI1SI03]